MKEGKEQLKEMKIELPAGYEVKSIELRDEFLNNFRPLIKKLKPLYGIKKGGEQ